MSSRTKRPWWLDATLLTPLAASVILACVWGRIEGPWSIAVTLVALAGAVLSAVHHAEVIALRVGEPFGTLVLALAVTVIEVALIVALMLSGGPDTSILARDTVFATVMIICNGVIGLCLLMGAIRHRVLEYRVEGTSPALSVLAALVVLTLVLPVYTSTTPGPTLSTSQLSFAGLVSLVLYCTFVFVQVFRHRDYFLPIGENAEAHAAAPSNTATMLSVALLLVCLVAVVGLAKSLAPSIESAVKAAGVPQAVVGIAIAVMVLLPETWAAVRAALRNRMQTSFNLAFGSALATIGLSIPAVAALSIYLGLPLQLGLPAKEIAMLAVTLLISVLTLSQSRATVLQGAVHLTLFAAFLFLTVVP